MYYPSLLLASAAFLCVAAPSQSIDTLALDSQGTRPIRSQPKLGGTFHVATGTWTRAVPDSARLGLTDVIYNNTANADWYVDGSIGLLTDSFAFVDQGRIPSTGSAGTANRDNYNINSISIGYCIDDNAVAAADVLISIYGSYVPCSDPSLQGVCSGEFLGTGLPGATAANIANGWATCWIVEFDLSGGNEICVLGDADGTFDADQDLDSFGIGIEFDPGALGGYVGGGISIGPMLAGDRRWTVQAIGEFLQSPGAGVAGCAVTTSGGGGGTYYGPAECCVPTIAGDNSSGLDNQDFGWIGDRLAVGAPSRCFWFGGYNNSVGCNADGGIFLNATQNANPNAGFYVKIAADQSTACVPTDCSGPSGSITSFCDPASNNSTGGPAVLTGAFGSGFETGLHLDVAGGPLPLPGGSRMLGYFLVGDSPSTGVSISDGLFCLIGSGGSFGRYNIAGTPRNSIGLFNPLGDLQNMVGTGGTSGLGFDVPFAIELPTLPLTTIMSGNSFSFQCWYRDSLAGSGHSNFSNAIEVTFN